MKPDLRRTPLYSRHCGVGAILSAFGGWEMPIQYEGIIAEHAWCRKSSALFDICHMGEFIFEGDPEDDGMEGIFTFSVKSIPVGRARYGFLLNDNGGVIDDLIVFRIDVRKFMIVVNAATANNDFKVISSRLNGGVFNDISGETAKLDLQGPLSRDVLADCFGDRISAIPYFRFVKMKICGVDAIVSRTGYTGELGYEIFLPSSTVGTLWEMLLADERVRAAGLGARDLLRLEMGYPLYGSDLDEETTPVEAALENFVDYLKEFPGKKALLEQKKRGIAKKRVAFVVDGRRSPRHDYLISVDGGVVGRVTSGGFSPMLGEGVGMGYVTPGVDTVGAKITISHENIKMEAKTCELPFYRSGSLRT